MKKAFTLLASLLVLQSYAQDPAPCSNLFFSEYIEGTSSNKALELYNPTPNPIDLTNYSIKIYFNGSTTSGATFLPQGTLLPGQTFTIANSLSTIFTSAVPDTTLGGVSVVSFNGDDAIVLYNATTAIDVIGQLGVDPGINWTVGTGATSEFTLVRKSTVHNGLLTWLGSGDASFDVYPQNTITFFGTHTMDACPALPLAANFTGGNVCLGDTTVFTNTSTGGTGPFTYLWDFGDGDTSHAENPMHVFMTPGCYNVTLLVVDAMMNMDTVSHTACAFEIPAALFSVSSDSVCLSSTIIFADATVFGTALPGTFVYDFGDGVVDSVSNASHTYDSAGTYVVTYTVTSSQGCVDVYTDTIVVLESDPMVTTADTILCNDSFGMFLEAGNPSGVWSGTFVSDSGGGNGFFSSAAIAPGTYEAYYTLSGICATSDTVFIYIPTNPVANFTYTITGSTVEFTNTSTNASTYNWTFGTAGTSVDVDPVFAFPSTGTFNVCLEAVSDSGCSNLQCTNITITGLNDLNSLPALKIYPIPANNNVVITGAQGLNITILNNLGQVVVNITNAQENHVVNVTGLPAGVYTVQTKFGHKTRLIISR